MVRYFRLFPTLRVLPGASTSIFCHGLKCHVLNLTDAHGHTHGGHAAHGPEGVLVGSGNGDQKDDRANSADVESIGKDDAHNHHRGNAFTDKAITQIIGVAILEFGVALHRYLSNFLMRLIILKEGHLVF